MNKLLPIIGTALAIGMTACSNTGHAVRGSSTALAVNMRQVASSPPPSYRDFPLVIESGQSQTAGSKPAGWGSAVPSYRDFPIVLDSKQTSAGASGPARWYRIAPQHPLMSEAAGQQTAMLPR